MNLIWFGLICRLLSCFLSARFDVTLMEPDWRIFSVHQQWCTWTVWLFAQLCCTRVIPCIYSLERQVANGSCVIFVPRRPGILWGLFTILCVCFSLKCSLCIFYFWQYGWYLDALKQYPIMLQKREWVHPGPSSQSTPVDWYAPDTLTCFLTCPGKTGNWW